MIPTENVKYALVIGEKPPYDAVTNPQERKWDDFLSSVLPKLPTNGKTQKIHDNIWLIPLDTEMRFLCVLFEWANNFQIPLRILFLDEPPDWIKYPSDTVKKS